MGVKRALSLKQVKSLFPHYTFTSLRPSSSGVVDTTYISDKYIIKYYERHIQERISLDEKILLSLYSVGLKVPRLLTDTEGWYLYEKLQGEVPKSIQLFHIQALARFMAKFHTQKLYHREDFLQKKSIQTALLAIKHTHYRLYKELEVLKTYTPKNDGFIHGDIFKDNTLFCGNKIKVFDFIDGGNGSYVFDIAVALLSFNTQNKDSFLRVFLNTYNQNSPRKIHKKELLENIKIAALFYGMLRLYEQKDTKRAKELIFR
ncbi:phosphotransferase [Sulfurimonas sp. SAG-AH-194-L11]|nr:phosphotransferase [Sulfurimonas sp. SAG-AH-194-L11]MDF1876253.1 phosphotransferase [Sulfurimonas sp. SAG-AH-194-L11]